MGDKIALIFGSMTDHSWDFLAEFRHENTMVISADGGILRAKEAGFTPDFYIGDSDSGGFVPKDLPAIALNPEKDWSDLHAAYNWAVEQGYEKVVFTACSGGRQDHNLNNLFLLELAKEQGILAKIVDSVNEIQVLPLGKTQFSCQGFQYFSVLPLDAQVTGLSIQNAKYPLENATVRRNQGLTISNEPLEGDVTITLETGVALLMKTQRIL